MRQRLGILIGLVVLVFVLIGLNAATYVQQEKTPDSESRPNRSTYNPGATGTQAFYTLLSETGRKVTRWREPMDVLKTKRDKPAVLVVIGETRRPFDEVEVRHLLAWVGEGGRLVLIDRTPEERILAGLTAWKLVAKTNDLELLIGMDSYDQKQMTSEMPASRPAQPSVFTTGVNAVQTSRFASHIEFTINSGDVDVSGSGFTPNALGQQRDRTPMDFYAVTPTPSPAGRVYREAPPPPAPKAKPTAENNTIQGHRNRDSDESITVPSNAPVVHLAGDGRNILIDAKYGSGSIAVLSDPYVVSNVGVGLVDNAQLAINLVKSGEGVVAFDEYHQGYGSNENRFFQYFAGTPVISIFLQLAAIASFVLYSQSRRFARPVPEPEPDRRTKLEYVAAMAELQQRTRAFDLAIENIYSDFRRRVCRLFGVDNTTTGRRQLAAMIAERIKGDVAEIEQLMLACEDIAHGEQVKGKDVLIAAARVRELEEQLGLVRNGKTKAVK
jgi:hypothetical protein